MGRVAAPTGVSLPSSLAQARIPRLPSAAYYIADFISEEEERLILDKVCSVTCLRASPFPLFEDWQAHFEQDLSRAEA